MQAAFGKKKDRLLIMSIEHDGQVHLSFNSGNGARLLWKLSFQIYDGGGKAAEVSFVC